MMMSLFFRGVQMPRRLADKSLQLQVQKNFQHLRRSEPAALDHLVHLQRVVLQ